jgi:hypothetical protein
VSNGTEKAKHWTGGQKLVQTGPTKARCGVEIAVE